MSGSMRRRSSGAWQLRAFEGVDPIVVHPDAVRSLERGEAHVISSGQAVRFLARRLSRVSDRSNVPT